MEILRTVGVEQIVRERSEGQFVQDGAIMAVDTLAGKELAWFISNLNEGVRDVSPVERVFISQSLLEPVLMQRAAELGAELHFGTELVSFEEDTDGVTAQIRERDSNESHTVRARYMVAADGAHSRIRDRLGIAMLGRGVFSKCVTIYFRANVAPLLRGRNLSVIYVSNPQLRVFFRFEKPFETGFLAIMALGDPKNPITDVSTGLTTDRCLELVRTALGSDDVPIAIENVMHWDAAAYVAERFQTGRIFLAGDAAHVMPPNGGFGGNTGVQDAQNLAWKLALVLRGTAGPGLLDTYEPERRPAGEFTAEQAYSRYVTRAAPYLGTDGIQPVEDDLNVELGYCYKSAAVISDGGVEPVHQSPRDSRGRPGTRAPHLWLEKNGTRISALDLFGHRFVLIAGPQGHAWTESAKLAAGKLKLELDVHQIEADGLMPAYGISATGAVLVRPDGFVAWRASTAEGSSPELLSGVLSKLISR
jgi:2-polyprenyl-6-methoxyphenol hydroxylase-like FAD-dependent oxidoreductase